MVTLLLTAQAVCAGEEPVAGVVPQTGALVVKVTNGTPGGSSPAGDTVTAYVYQHAQPMNKLTAKVGDGGMAVLEDVPTGETFSALVRAQHQGVAFSGQMVRLLPTDGQIEASVEVFDSITDTSHLTVSMHHMIIESEASSLVISEFLQLSNNSEYAICSKETGGRVVSIGLSKGYTNLTPQRYFETDALVATEDGFYDTMAVAPGSYEVGFSYTLDIDSSVMDISRGITMPTSQFVVFMKVPSLKIEGLEAVESSMTDSAGRPLEYYKRSDLAAGDELSFQIAGFNIETSWRGTWLILSVVFGAVAVLALFRAIRGKAEGC